MAFDVSRILAKCREHNIKPARAGALAGLSPDYIRNLERGTVQEPTLAKLGALADVLTTNPLFLASMIENDAPSGALDRARTLDIEGRVGIGLWYDERASYAQRTPSRIAPDPREGGRQFALIADDESMAALACAVRGAVLHCVESAHAAPGDVIILKRANGALTELSARLVIEGREQLLGATCPAEGPSVADPIGPGGVIVARVLAGYVNCPRQAAIAPALRVR